MDPLEVRIDGADLQGLDTYNIVLEHNSCGGCAAEVVEKPACKESDARIDRECAREEFEPA